MKIIELESDHERSGSLTSNSPVYINFLDSTTLLAVLTSYKLAQSGANDYT